MTECADCLCKTHWAFRQTPHTGKWLCDPCWGYRYEGDAQCWNCERSCYVIDDWQDSPLRNVDVYLCGHCVRHLERIEAVA